MSQVDSVEFLEAFWRNVYLRGQMLYDPTGNVGDQLYEQPPGGIPFSRGWIVDRDQNVVLPVFGHQPDRVIRSIHGLLGDPDCAEMSKNCLIFAVGPESPRLMMARGPCEPSTLAVPVDVVRGDLAQLQDQGSSIELGTVSCVASGEPVDRWTDVSANPTPGCVGAPSFFYLARFAGASNYGDSSEGTPRDSMTPDAYCP